METGNQGGAAKRAAVNGLAVVGFIALIFAGITLAIYAARFVPTAVNNLGTAAVYFSSVLGGNSDNGELEAVIPFEDESSPTEEVMEEVVAEEEPVAPAPAPEAFRPAPPAAGTPTSGTYLVVGAPSTPAPAPFGFPDLKVTITERGYLDSGSTDSYVKSDEVPDGKRGAITFVVENIGTNVSGDWRFEADVPTNPSYTFRSPSQDSLTPGARIEYVLGFDRTRSGENRTVTITVDSAEAIEESNENNNDDSETLVIN